MYLVVGIRFADLTDYRGGFGRVDGNHPEGSGQIGVFFVHIKDIKTTGEMPLCPEEEYVIGL